MMPFRGSYHSNSGYGRKNIPAAMPSSQPTAPSFNIPAAPNVQPEANTAPNVPPVQKQPPQMAPAEAPPVMPPEKAAQPTVPSKSQFTPTVPAKSPFTPYVMPSQEMNIPGSVLPETAAPQVPQAAPMMPQTPCMYMQPMYQNPMVQPTCPYINNQMPFGTGDINLMGMYEDADMTIRVPNTDPPPVISNNPTIPSISFFKELTGYPNYGNPSGNADILYTGNRGVWTMDIAPFLLVPGNQRAQIIISAVLDDHYNVPVRQYSLRITVNDTVVHNGPVNLEHGRPSGGRFNNWQPLTFNINVRRNNRIVIENTSSSGPNDWIAFDWMEIRLAQR